MTAHSTVARTREEQRERVRWSLGLVVALARKNFATKYARSYLGSGWLVLQPLVQALVFTIVFVKIFKITRVEHYPLYVLSGVMPWAFTTNAIQSANVAIVENASLVRKVDVPRLVFPAAAVGGAALAFLAPLVILACISLGFGDLDWRIVMLPVALALHLLLVFAFGTLFCSFHVSYRDVRYFVESGFVLLFYGTPILYDLSIVPEGARDLLRANPATGLLSLYRFAFMGRPLDGLAIALSVGVGLVVLVLGLVAFRRRSRDFADLL